MSDVADIVFLFDVDNTLLDNDRFQEELRDRLLAEHGEKMCERYWARFEIIREELGYADYLGALEQLRLEAPHDPKLLAMANWLVDYPFADRLYPHALDVVKHVRQWGPAVILSDGDAVFQPRKVARSGLWEAFDGNILIYVHKESELAFVEQAYPAKRYVLVDDKVRILKAVKGAWKNRVTTVFPKQGHYAFDPAAQADAANVDIAIAAIGDLLRYDLSKFTS
jgi:FMN phosphatase YigB (HAD superfamily)